MDLRAGLGQVKRNEYYVTSPPLIAGRVAVVGGWVYDNQSVDEPSGAVRAFDVETGRLVWNWDAGRPEATAPITPGQTYTRGTPNAWAPAAYDEQLGLIYLPTGNQSPDYWGGHRKDPAQRFSSAIVALNAADGRVRWAYQTVHHDLWDYDVPAQPALVDLRLPSGVTPALVAPTKRGDIFVLDRRTGHPIVAAPERPVPKGAAPGDRVSPTQPFSRISMLRPPLREADMWGVTPFDQLWCRIQFRRARYEGLFTPPGLRPTISYPGSYGIFNWGGVAVDPQTGRAVINASYAGYYTRLVPRDAVTGRAKTKPQFGTPFAVDSGPFLSPLGLPCTPPPWGELAAIDLKAATFAWRQRFGTTRDRGAFGLPLPVGMPSVGGPLITRSGLVFIGAAADDYLRAYDLSSGRELWRGRLPAGGQASPMTYVSERSGRQYVVIAAGGHSALGTRLGDYVVAYALPAPGP